MADAASGGGWGANGSLSGKASVDSTLDGGTTSIGEPAQVLMGHKNGFPVFGVDWCRDGRTLLSAGGDGSVRLWDVAAVGAYGRLANVTKRTSSHAAGLSSVSLTCPPALAGNASGASGTTPPLSAGQTDATGAGGGPSSPPLSVAGGPSSSDPDLRVTGSRSESLVEASGAALAVYRGHSPSTPVWSVEFAPSGYYFASAGSDYTARVWATDRPAPVRILSGHTSPNVNCISWHPNVNYILGGGDDRTVRMWDVQTGQCVRLLSGARDGINVVRVCPSGRYAAGADHGGVVHLWDLGTGRKVNELRPTPPAAASTTTTAPPAIHSMSYSACGTALATGGDDYSVRVWDVRGAAAHEANAEYASARGWGRGGGGGGCTAAAAENRAARRPVGERVRPGRRVPAGVFRTIRTVILDLQYTNRNLLLSVGKYMS